MNRLSATMTMQVDLPGRSIAAAAALIFAMALSLVFYGTAVNLVVLALVDAALMLALVCIGPRGLIATFAASRGSLALPLAMLGYLVVAYRISLSPDTSFAPSWVLAAGPLAFLGAAALCRNARARHAMVIAVLGLVIALAANSCVRFAVWGERAHLPLADANGYGALIYLVWIPLVHAHLVRCWRAEAGDSRADLYVAGASFVMLLALLATRSRTSVLIVCVALLCWAVIVVLRRVPWRPLLVQFLVAAAAVAAWRVFSAASGTGERGLEFGGGLQVRFDLVHAALAMFKEHPLGIGVFCFPMLYPTFRPTSEQETTGLFVHNDYVQFLVEGGLPLLLLLLAFVVVVMRRGIALAKRRPDDAEYHQLGVALALAAVCAHALVNFVFYSLPLGILIGLSAAYLLAPSAPLSAPSEQPRDYRTAAGVLMIAGWTMWLYLVLDVAIIGVFQGQPSVPLVASIRADEQRMLQFARTAERLNGDRGIPALGEALLLYRALRAEPDSVYLREQTYAAFRHALEVDPWNSLIYLRLAQFLDEFPPPEGRRNGESAEDLLSAAIGLDPVFIPGIDQLLKLYAARGDDANRYLLLRKLVYPWIPTVRRLDPTASDRYLSLLEGYADTAGDAAFAAEVRQRRKDLARFVPAPRTKWFF